MKPLIKEVEFTPIKPQAGLIGFASLVINDQLFLSSIGVHTRLDGKGYRVTYPNKKIADRSLDIFHPVNRITADALEEAISKKVIALTEAGYAAGL